MHPGAHGDIFLRHPSSRTLGREIRAHDIEDPLLRSLHRASLSISSRPHQSANVHTKHVGVLHDQ
jgi:hypothetical protein